LYIKANISACISVVGLLCVLAGIHSSSVYFISLHFRRSLSLIAVSRQQKITLIVNSVLRTLP